VTECWPIPVVVRERIVAALKTTVRDISNIALTTANDQASKVSPNPEKKWIVTLATENGRWQERALGL